MTLDDFARLAAERVPTPQEFCDFVAAMGWRIAVEDDGTASLKADAADPVAVKLCRMLAREPYRSGVIAAARAKWPPPPPGRPLREWKFPGGTVMAEPPGCLDDPSLDGVHPGRATHWRNAGETEWRAIERDDGWRRIEAESAQNAGDTSWTG